MLLGLIELAYTPSQHPPRWESFLSVASEPADVQPPSERLLREMFGLTRTERDVAARLALGRTPAEITAERRSALETVRRQTKQILAKTGARHRSQLVRMMLTRPPERPE